VGRSSESGEEKKEGKKKAQDKFDAGSPVKEAGEGKEGSQSERKEISLSLRFLSSFFSQIAPGSLAPSLRTLCFSTHTEEGRKKSKQDKLGLDTFHVLPFFNRRRERKKERNHFDGRRTTRKVGRVNE